jgi:hypothetical protein
MSVFLCLAMILAGIPSYIPEFRTDDVSIEFQIFSNDYEYKVTNLSQTPIVGFMIKPHASYFYGAPEGWQKETSSSLFRTWTENSQFAIKPNQTAMFSLRVGSKGALLRKGSVEIKFQSGKVVIIPDVLIPGPEPQTHLVIVVGTLLFIFLLHFTVLMYKKRRKKKVDINGV